MSSRPYLSPEDMQHLTPGVLDDAAAEFFANGHCASMALALHHLTHWPIYRFAPITGLSGWYTSHAVVKSPRGFLDAQGFDCLEVWRESRDFEWDDYKIIHKDDLPYASENLHLVYPFATALLRRYFPELKVAR